MIASFWAYFGSSGLPPHAQNQSSKPLTFKKPKCWRIENVPAAWSRRRLLEHLQAHDQSLASLEEHWLLLYPVYSGKTQTALLNTERTLQYFQDLGSNRTHSLQIVERSETGERAEVVDLSIDCHFHGLTPLNSPAGDNIVDVVAVTGLSGHAFGSWRNWENYRMWLTDFLPKDIPNNIRVLTYGYNSSLTQQGKLGLIEYRRTFVQNLSNARSSSEERSRPLVLIGHSLGCILIAQALLQSQNNPNDKHILDSTRVVCFFGAPHAGMNVDALVAMVEDLTSSPNIQSTRLRLLDQLREDSDFLDDQRERLIQIWDGLRILSFYEVNETRTVEKDAVGDWGRRGEAVQMVKNFSALLCLKQEFRYPIHEDHTNMVKFMTPTDKNYQSVIHHIGECLDQHLKSRSEKKLELERIRSEELNDFLNTLEAFSCQSFRDDLLDLRHGGSCRWFFCCDKYKDWVGETSTANLLWISGDPGSGKSVLMSYVTKELANIHRTNNGGQAPLVAYFFCDDKRNEQKPATAILRSLIYQILSQAPLLHQHIPCEYLPDSKFAWGFGSLWQVFTSIVTNNNGRKIFCLVDALDECEEKSRERFLENLIRLLGRSPGGGINELASKSNFRMIITSRPELPSTRELPTFTSISLEDRNTQDIWAFVDDQVDRLARIKKLPNDLKVDIRQALVDGAVGMFLWVSLTLYNLGRSSGTSARSIRAQLKELPKDIPAIYARILEEIDPALQKQAKRILQWVNCAKRPLQVEELKIIIALQPEHTSITAIQDDIENNLGYFFSSLLGPLLKIERNTVRFVHQSVKDFLTNPKLMNTFDPSSDSSSPLPAPMFHISDGESNRHLAIDCLHYLSFEEFENRPSIDALESYSQLTTDPFFDYAATQWPEHVSGADRKNDEGLLEAFLKLANSNTKMASAYQIYYEHGEFGEYGLRPPSRPPLKHTPPLQICVSLGFPDLVRALLADGADINEQGGVYGSALLAAIWNRSEGMVKLVLNEAKGDISVAETVLEKVAEWCEDPETLELLLSRGSRVTEAAMVAAAHNQHGSEALECLLNRGGQVTEAIMKAVVYSPDSEPLLELVLAAGGLVTERVLLTAADGPNPNKTLKLLLSKHGQVTEAMITATVRKGGASKELVELMLDIDGGTNMPITEAMLVAAAGSEKGNEVTEFLLSRGGQISEAVMWAASGNWNSTRPLKSLLARDRTIPITEGMLVTAARNKHAMVYMSLLLSRGGQVTEEVMVSAARNWAGGKELLEKLLAKGGQITAAVLLATVDPAGYEVLSFLLSRGGMVTEGMIVRALRIPRSKHVLKLLLSAGNLAEVVGQEVMVQAATSEFSDRETLEFLLSRGGQVTEEVIVAAAGNINFGAEVLKELVGRGGGRVTRDMLAAAAWNYDLAVENLEALLSIDSTAAIDEEMVVDATRNPDGLEALKYLLRFHNTPITEIMLLEAALNTHANKFLAPLLERAEGPLCDQITERVLVAAACNWKGGEALRFLLSMDDTLPITEAVLAAVAGNLMAAELFEYIQEKGHTIETTESILVRAVENGRDRGVVEFLLRTSNDNIPITEAVLIAATSSERANTFWESLLIRGGYIPYGHVTEAVMVAAAAGATPKELLITLLSKNNSTPMITEAVLVAAAANQTGGGALEFLLNTCDNIYVTEAVLVAAAGNYSAQEALEPLLGYSKNPTPIMITEGVLLAAARNTMTERALEFLLSTGNNLPITETVLIAAVGSYAAKEKLGLLLWKTAGEMPITEAVLVAAAANWAAPKQLLEQLLSNPNITASMITEAVLVAAAANQRGLELLLSTYANIPITEAVLLAAARHDQYNHTLELLLSKGGQITETVLIGAAQTEHGDLLLGPLLRSGGQVTEAVMVAAARNCNDNDALEFLLAKAPTITITQAMLLAAVAVANSLTGKKALELFLGRSDAIPITEAVLVAAVANSKEAFEPLLNKAHDTVPATEAILVGATWNPHGNQNLDLLFTIYGGITITETVMLGAALNPGGKSNLEFLLDRGGQVTERVMAAAAWNPSAENLLLLLGRGGQITNLVMMGAMMNPGGKQNFEFLLSKGGNFTTESAATTTDGRKTTLKESIDFLLDSIGEAASVAILRAAKDQTGGGQIELLFRTAAHEMEIVMLLQMEGVVSRNPLNQNNERLAVEAVAGLGGHIDPTKTPHIQELMQGPHGSRATEINTENIKGALPLIRTLILLCDLLIIGGLIYGVFMYASTVVDVERFLVGF